MNYLFVLSLLLCTGCNSSTERAEHEKSNAPFFQPAKSDETGQDTSVFPFQLPIALDSARQRLKQLGFRADPYTGHVGSWLGRHGRLDHNGADPLFSYRISWRNRDSVLITSLYAEVEAKLHASFGQADSLWKFEGNDGWGAQYLEDSIEYRLFYIGTKYRKEHAVNLAVMHRTR